VRFGDLCFTDEGDEDIAIALSMMVQPAEFGCNLWRTSDDRNRDHCLVKG
jgi:hypothetical protein